MSSKLCEAMVNNSLHPFTLDADPTLIWMYAKSSYFICLDCFGSVDRVVSLPSDTCSVNIERTMYYS